MQIPCEPLVRASYTLKSKDEAFLKFKGLRFWTTASSFRPKEENVPSCEAF